MDIQDKSNSVVLEEVTRQLIVLEEAITRINATRTQLKHRSMEVKSDIHTAVTRQLEALRERETCLLHQVDLIQQAKDAALKGQEDKLHEALGSLTTALKMEEQGSQGRQLVELMKRLKTVTTYPSETTNLSFCADLAHTKDILANFGYIDVHGLAQRMFDPEASSTSLPRAFEDYDDDEHHVLYKSVAEGSSGAACTREVTVNVPQLSQRPEDWLFLPTESLVPVKTCSDQFLFPPFGSTKVATLMDQPSDLGRSISSTASIHQWLCDIQGGGEEEQEEADFEVISPPPYFIPPSSKDSSIEILSFPGEQTSPVFTIGDVNSALTSISPPLPVIMTTSPFNPGKAYFEEVKTCLAKKWLLNGCGVEESGVIYHEILKYFHEVSNDTHQWLASYEKKQLESCPDQCTGSSSTPIDIENLTKLMCIHDKTPNNTWLVARKDDDVDVDEMEMQGVCKANEPCQSFTECLSDERCCGEKVIGGYFAAVKQSKQGWLSDGKRDEMETNLIEFPPFAQPVGCDWLMNDARVPPSSFESIVSLNGPEMTQWLSPAASLTNLFSLEENWKLRFTHSLPSSPVRGNDNVCNKPSSLCEWLLPGLSFVPNIPMSAKAEWLFTSSTSNTNKELKNVPDKNIELPECSNDEPDDSPMMEKSLFECFKNEEPDKKKWLCNVNLLVE